MKKFQRVKAYRIIVGNKSDKKFVQFENPGEEAAQLLRQALHERIVEFDYYKTNGRLRHARGTLLEAYLPELARPTAKSAYAETRKDVLTYWDLAVNAWRSCVARQICGYYE